MPEEKTEESKNRLNRKKQQLEHEVAALLEKLKAQDRVPTPGLDLRLTVQAVIDVLVAKGLISEEELKVRFLELSKEIFARDVLAEPQSKLVVAR